MRGRITWARFAVTFDHSAVAFCASDRHPRSDEHLQQVMAHTQSKNPKGDIFQRRGGSED
jgi:hypothetical protein